MPGYASIDQRGAKTVFSRGLRGESAFAEKVKRAAGKKMQPMVQKVADDAVIRAELYISENYQSRDGWRHKKGKIHLHGSIRGRAVGTTNSRGNEGFPFTVEIYSLADARMVNALNSGSPPHKIGPRPGGGFLYMPRKGLGQSYPFYKKSKGRPVKARQVNRQGRPLRIKAAERHKVSPAAAFQARATSTMNRTKIVQHPGIAPSYFMELSVERAVEVALRKTVRMQRR